MFQLLGLPITKKILGKYYDLQLDKTRKARSDDGWYKQGTCGGGTPLRSKRNLLTEANKRAKALFDVFVPVQILDMIKNLDVTWKEGEMLWSMGLKIVQEAWDALVGETLFPKSNSESEHGNWSYEGCCGSFSDQGPVLDDVPLEQQQEYEFPLKKDSFDDYVWSAYPNSDHFMYPEYDPVQSVHSYPPSYMQDPFPPAYDSMTSDPNTVYYAEPLTPNRWAHHARYSEQSWDPYSTSYYFDPYAKSAFYDSFHVKKQQESTIATQTHLASSPTSHSFLLNGLVKQINLIQSVLKRVWNVYRLTLQ